MRTKFIVAVSSGVALVTALTLYGLPRKTIVTAPPHTTVSPSSVPPLADAHEKEVMANPKVADTYADLKKFAKAIQSFQIDCGRVPSTEEGLHALRTAPTNAKGWKGPYFSGPIPSDAWDKPFKYESGKDGQSFQVSSDGDGRRGLAIEGSGEIDSR